MSYFFVYNSFEANIMSHQVNKECKGKGNTQYNGGNIIVCMKSYGAPAYRSSSKYCKHVNTN